MPGYAAGDSDARVRRAVDPQHRSRDLPEFAVGKSERTGGVGAAERDRLGRTTWYNRDDARTGVDLLGNVDVIGSQIDGVVAGDDAGVAIDDADCQGVGAVAETHRIGGVDREGRNAVVGAVQHHRASARHPQISDVQRTEGTFADIAVVD